MDYLNYQIFEYRVFNITSKVSMIRKMNISDNVESYGTYDFRFYDIINLKDKAYISWFRIIGYSYDYDSRSINSVSRTSYFPISIYNLMYAEIDLNDYNLNNVKELFNNTDFDNLVYFSLINFQKIDENTIYGIWYDGEKYKFNQWLGYNSYFNGKDLYANSNEEIRYLSDFFIIEYIIVGIYENEATIHFAIYSLKENRYIFDVKLSEPISYEIPYKED